ncbi:hypothetical protein [Ellagibacter isourolithinifaciens]|uniref:hypothetical protein n=1 Tax=Ellagibacter isourolithinifaciens TaxID=2137581 RepID=UPI003A92F767
MISNEERREVAERLRSASARRSDAPWMVEDLMLALGFRCYEDGEDQLFDRLADLIDRPAIKPEPSGRAYWLCPRCGAFNYRSAVTDCCGVIPAHYCANCGAEVVE